jgi:hypothetical protein
MDHSVRIPAAVLVLLFSSFLILGTVGRVSTSSGTGAASKNHGHGLLELHEAVKEHAEFRVSDKAPQSHLLRGLGQQVRNEHSRVSRMLLQAEETLEAAEKHREVHLKCFLSTVSTFVFD